MKSYRQAIQTTFKCNNKGQQYIYARCAGGSLKFNWDYSLDTADNHHAAAIQLMKKMKWNNEILGGCVSNSDYVFVLIPEAMEVKSYSELLMNDRNQKRKFISDLIDEFKSYAMDDIAEGYADENECPDHLEFLKLSFEHFIDCKLEEDE